MRHSIKLLLCCLCLAGCAEAEAEVAMKAVDLSKPVPPHTFFVECGRLEGITMYPVPLAGKYTVEGKYRLSSSRNDLSVQDYLKIIPGDNRVIVSIPEDPSNRDNGVNANFFVHGLANGCTGVFAAFEVTLMRTERMLESSWEYGLTHSSVVDAAYLAFDRDARTSADVNKNALFINAIAWNPTKSSGVNSFMLFNAEVYGDLVRLDE
jgi:hypothetical protein